MCNFCTINSSIKWKLCVKRTGRGTNGEAEQHSNVKTLVGHQKVVEGHTRLSIKEDTMPRSGKQGKPRVEWHKIGYPIVTALSDGSMAQRDNSTVYQYGSTVQLEGVPQHRAIS